MIKTIIFDFAGVLVEETTMAMESKYHFNQLSKAKQNQYIRTIHASNLGKVSSAKLLQVMHKTLLPHLSISEILDRHINPKPLPTIKLLQKLRQQGYQIVIFSNHQKTWPKLTAKNLGINLTGISFVNSSLVGMSKPHLNYYHYLISKHKINPTEAIFIDDRAANLVPAKKLGMKVFHYQNNYSELLKYLKKLKVMGL